MTDTAVIEPSLHSLRTLAQPLTLPCGLTLPNRLVKCPMQETLAEAPVFDPPVASFRNLYNKWGSSDYGLIITGKPWQPNRGSSVLVSTF